MAAELGASWAGAVFAGGPRKVDIAGARAMFSGLAGAAVGRVGVVGADPVDALLRIADEARLDVLQLHDGATADRLLTLRRWYGGALWMVVRVTGAVVEAVDDARLELVDAVVLDTAVGGRSGGTGVPFDWGGAAAAARTLAARRPVVLAGGLRAANVGEAVRRLAPWAVDVSSGVESAPGIKDHGQMRAFATAARAQGE